MLASPADGAKPDGRPSPCEGGAGPPYAAALSFLAFSWASSMVPTM